MAFIEDIIAKEMNFEEQSSVPGTPSSGTTVIYAKTDGCMYVKDDAGTETCLMTTNIPLLRWYMGVKFLG
jgi:hypothetical protein